MADIIFNYHPGDRPTAENLAARVTQLGWSVLWNRNVTPRPSLDEAAEARCIVVLWTNRSIKSRLLRHQAEIAAERGILLAVRVEPVTPPMSEEGITTCDLFGWNGDTDAAEFREFIHAISVMAPIHTNEAAHQVTQRLFICYRRDDTQDAAGRLYDRLVDSFGADRVFMDIDSVPLGIDFVEHLTEQIGRCSAVIVMIGKQWHTIKDKKRRRRLDNEDDLVRAEIRAALQQQIPVIPVTVQNAIMPQAEDLPDDIRLLARRNGIQLDAARWRTDVERLLKELDRVMKPKVLKQADKRVLLSGDKAADLEAKVRRDRRQSEPILELVFEPDKIPYLQTHPLPDGTQIRMYRVGIRNTSGDVIEGARAVLEEVVFLLDGVPCPPTTEHSLPIEHALNVMGEDVKDGRFKLNSGDRPSAFIDVVGQRRQDGIYMKSFSFCYATGFGAMLQLDVDGPWLFRLRIEGGAKPINASFTVGLDERGLMVMNRWNE